nr:hypothetical protein [Tanacetum cinerariifolium]
MARVESSSNKEILGKDASKQGRIDAINVDEEITLISVQDEVVSNYVGKEIFDVDVLDGEEVFVIEHEVAVKGLNDEVNVFKEVVKVINTAVSAATTTNVAIIMVGNITLAQALKEIKSTKPKEKDIVIQELEPMKLMKRKDQIRLDEEDTLKLQAVFDEEERLAKIDADHQLAKRMQAQEQEELSITEKATLFQQLLEKRRKHFAAKRAKEKRNKPPTKAEQRKIMVNTFEDFRIELGEGKEKRARTELIQDITKKQKVEDDKEKAELKQFMEIILDEEEVVIDVIPLSFKSLKIVDWKIY